MGQALIPDRVCLELLGTEEYLVRPGGWSGRFRIDELGQGESVTRHRVSAEFAVGCGRIFALLHSD